MHLYGKLRIHTMTNSPTATPESKPHSITVQTDTLQQIKQRIREVIEKIRKKKAEFLRKDEEPRDEEPITLADRFVADVSSIPVNVYTDEDWIGATIERIDGELYIKELPTSAHESSKALLSEEIGDWDFRHECVLRGARSTAFLFGGNVVQPDNSWCHSAKPSPSSPVSPNNPLFPYPSLILEVAEARRLAEVVGLTRNAYLAEQSIRLVLVVKFYARRQCGAFAALAMLFGNIAQRPAIPTAAISFGTANLSSGTCATLKGLGIPWSGVGIKGTPACNALGIPQYQLHLPTSQVYHPVDVPNGVPKNINLDLFRVQNVLDGTLPHPRRPQQETTKETH